MADSEAPALTPSAIERLPVEIVELILCSLDDAFDLRNVALCSSRLYAVLRASERLLATTVFCNQTTDTRHDAAVALQTSYLAQTQSLSTNKPDIRPLFANERKARGKQTLCTALRVAELEMCIRGFTASFVEKCFNNKEAGLQFTDPCCPSTQEISRIKRAFYRFEIYCNLFRDHSDQIDEMQTAGNNLWGRYWDIPYKSEEAWTAGVQLYNQHRDRQRQSEQVWKADNRRFFQSFSPWEVEQLVCIQEFLGNEVAKAFNDVAAHDVYWGFLRVPSHQDAGSGYIQRILKLGLVKLWPICTASSYDERYAALYISTLAEGPEATDYFLSEALKHGVDDYDGNWLGRFNSEEERAFIRPSIADDNDRGPAKIWRLAYEKNSPRCFFTGWFRHTLWKWGYVMWDFQRLNQLNIFDMSFQNVIFRYESMPDDSTRSSWESMREREYIYYLGGRGKWEFGNMNEIVWEGGSPRYDNRWAIELRAYIEPSMFARVHDLIWNCWNNGVDRSDELWN